MAKKILYESAVHQFLAAAKRLQSRMQTAAPAEAAHLARWVAVLSMEYPGPGELRVRWAEPAAGEYLLSLKGAHFYTRGDAEAHYQRQAEAGMVFKDDQVAAENAAYFDSQVRMVLAVAGVFAGESPVAAFNENALVGTLDNAAARKHAEEVFHDEWAADVDVHAIDVRKMNEACTAPEMRHIRARLGDLHGRRLLDVGCGLGEAGVYFAMEGADVTASDISPGMLEVTQRLAAANGVKVRTVLSAAEDLGLDPAEPFDIIYTGNTLHHVDIAQTLDRLLPFLKPDGVFASWDPVAYNPIINVYRAIATKVRTEDEHPLHLRDLRLIRSRFETTDVRWCWLTTLTLFILMALVQLRSPNKERFWKKVVEEADRWAWLYRPLEWIDRVLLTLMPFLGPLCWNVVVIGRGPRISRPLGLMAARLNCAVCETPLAAANSAFVICNACGHRHVNGRDVDGAVDNERLEKGRAIRLDGLTRAQVELATQTAVVRRSLLDVGSGTGKFLYHAKAMFETVIGVEVSEASVRFATQELGLTIFADVAETAGPFDVVTSWHAFEHIPGHVLMDMVKNLRLRCGADSRVIICVPNPDCWAGRWLGSHWAFRDPSAHLHEFSRASLDRLLLRGGFKAVRARRIFAYTVFAAVQSFANLSPLPHNYLYYRLKRGSRFGWDRAALLFGDALAVIWLLPATLVGGIVAVFEHLWAKEKAVHVVVYRLE